MLKNNGVTSNTPENIPLGAGTYYKNLTYGYTLTTDKAIVAGKDYYTKAVDVYTKVVSPLVADIATYYELGWSGTVIGATSGGGTFKYEAEYVDVELDGVTVLVKGISKQKVGESASLESTIAEYSAGIISQALHLVKDLTLSNAEYDCYVTKDSISDSDYLDNVAFVGYTATGKAIIIILPNALCTSAFELKGENKKQGTYSITFDCTQDLSAQSLNKLPVQWWFPVVAEV